MDIEALAKLAGLVLVAVVSLGAILLLLRAEGKPASARPELEAGFPLARFPNRDATRHQALQRLMAVQRRLLMMYHELDSHSEGAIWLLTFLVELRAIMDTAYRAAAVSPLYATAAPLNELAAEIERIEAELASHISLHLFNQRSADRHEVLDARLAALRLCARRFGMSGESR